MDNDWIGVKEDGVLVKAFRRSKIDVVERDFILRNDCLIGVNGTVIRIPNTDVQTVLSDIIGVESAEIRLC